MTEKARSSQHHQEGAGEEATPEATAMPEASRSINETPEEDPATRALREDHEPPGQVPLRNDPLSMFLLVAIVVLGVMVLYEGWRDGRLEDQAELARLMAAQSGLDANRCAVGVAGQAGERLVLDCTGLALQEAAQEAAPKLGQQLPAGGAFEEVVLRGRDGIWICPPMPGRWGAGDCRQVASPGRDSVAAARERARQRRLERK